MNPSTPTFVIDDALWSRSIRKDVARQLVGQTLECFYGDQHGHTHSAALQVTAFTDKSREGQSMQQFVLLFAGPSAPLLPTQTYRLRHAEMGDFAVFISALGRSKDGFDYEACFSHEG